MKRSAAALSLVLVSFAAVMVTATVALGPGLPDTGDVPQLVVGFLSALLGGFLLYRVADNVLGWVIAGFGLVVIANEFLEHYAVAALPGAPYAAWITGWLWILLFLGLLVAIPLLFPDGRLLTRRWRWVPWVAAAGGFLTFLGNASVPDLVEKYGLANPLELGIPVEVTDGVAGIGAVMWVAGSIGAITSATVRFRRSQGELRQQMKWFAASAVLLVVDFPLVAWASESGRDRLARSALMAGALILLTAIAVAILRYRLYDIDRIISRTVSYGLVVWVLGSVFVGVVTGVGAVLPSDNSLAVAASTLVVAALFNPVRRRVQRGVDRRFNRSRYDAERVMEEFTGSLQDRVDPDGVVEGWVGVVAETMQPSSVGVWVRQP